VEDTRVPREKIADSFQAGFPIDFANAARVTLTEKQAFVASSTALAISMKLQSTSRFESSPSAGFHIPIHTPIPFPYEN
jgi:hypothetical protein